MAAKRNPHLDMFPPYPDLPLRRKEAALMIIDMQVLDACWGKGLTANLPDDGTYDYWKRRLALITKNIAKLLAAFRAKGMLVIHTRMESLLEDGRDRSLQHKILGIHAAPGSEDGQIIRPLKPRKGELVFTKTASCPFNSTNVHYVLRNLEIKQLVVTGVVTNGCVSTTVRNASDLSYEVIVPEDACGALYERFHVNEIEILKDDYAKITSTAPLLREIQAL
jgi:nicotinamidase-related amidase